MKNKLILNLATLLLIPTALLISTQCRPKTHTKTTSVLILTPETGPASEYAKYSRMGFDLGLASAKEQGLPTLQITYTDSKSNPKEGLSALQQGLVANKPDMVITLLSSVTNAVAPVLADSGIPAIANAVAAPGLAKPEQGLFRVFPTSTEVSSIAASRLNELNARKVAVIYVNDEYGIGCRTTFADKAKEVGLTIVANEPFQAVEKDFRNQWSRLLSLEPDAVFVAGYGPGYVTVLQHLAEREFKGIIMTDFTLTAPPVLKAVSGLPDNCLVVAPKISEEFRERARSAFPEAAYFVNLATAHDSILLMAEAVKLRADKPSDDLKTALRNSVSQRAALGVVQFNEKGDVVVPLEIIELKSVRAGMEQNR